MTWTSIARRLVQGILVVFGVTIVTFIITHLIGDPVRLLLPLNASRQQYDAIQRELGLNQPLFSQFGNYLSSLVLHGSFGISIWQNEPALGLAVAHVWPTVELGLAGIVLGALVALPAGAIAALRANTLIDRCISMTAMLGVSIANFWLGLILILVFAVELRWFPPSGYGPREIILPALAVAAYPFGTLTQITRTAMLEELSQPYVQAARARGIPVSQTVLRHAGRNVLIAVITVSGFEFGRIIGGFLIVIETIFNWPGIGYLSLQAVTHYDFPLIEACTFVIAVLVVGINLSVDLLNTLVDPRLREA